MNRSKVVPMPYDRGVRFAAAILLLAALLPACRQIAPYEQAEPPAADAAGREAAVSDGALDVEQPPDAQEDIFSADFDPRMQLTHVSSRAFGGADFSRVRDVALAPQERLVVVGEFNGTHDFGGGPLEAGLSSSLFISSYRMVDGNMAHEWTHTADAESDSSVALRVAVNAQGDTFVVGSINGGTTIDTTVLAATDRDAFVARIDAFGKLQWARRVGGMGNDDGRAVAITSQGAIFGLALPSADATYDSGALLGSTGHDAALLHLDRQGAVLWDRPSLGSAGALNALAATDDAIFVGGRVNGSVWRSTDPVASQGDDAVVTRHHPTDGTLQRAWHWGGPSNDQVFDLSASAPDTLYAGGLFGGSADFDGVTLTAAPGADGFVLALDTTSEELRWVRQVQSSGVATVRALEATPLGVIAVGDFNPDLIVDSTKLDTSGMYDLFLLHLAHGDGRSSSTRIFGGLYSEFASSAALGQGRLALGGSFATETHFGGQTLQAAGTISGFTVLFSL